MRRLSIILVALALIASACGDDDTTATTATTAAAVAGDPFEGQVLEIRQAAIRALPNLPQILAPDSPYAEEFGIVIIDVPVSTPTDYVTGLGRGDLNVVPGTPSIAIAARDSGVKLVNVASGSHGFTQFMISNDLNIAEGDWDAFKAAVDAAKESGTLLRMGGVLAASTNYVLCYDTLVAKGIEPEVDIEIVNLPIFPEHPGALERGEVDMLCSTEPFNTFVWDRGIGTFLDTPFETEAGDILGALITTDADLADPERREALKRWMKVVFAIMEDLEADRSIPRQWIMDTMELDEEAANRMLSFAYWDPPSNLVQLAALANGHFRIGQTEIDWSTRMDEWTDDTLLAEILAEG